MRAAVGLCLPASAEGSLTAKPNVARKDSHLTPMAVCHGAHVVVDWQTLLRARAMLVDINNLLNSDTL